MSCCSNRAAMQCNAAILPTELLSQARGTPTLLLTLWNAACGLATEHKMQFSEIALHLILFPAPAACALDVLFFPLQTYVIIRLPPKKKFYATPHHPKDNFLHSHAGAVLTIPTLSLSEMVINTTAHL